MADILIRCPTLHWAVPTGLTTDIIKLDTLEIPLTRRKTRRIVLLMCAAVSDRPLVRLPVRL
jgi:hypothetical protein